jgi:hypothetical protein
MREPKQPNRQVLLLAGTTARGRYDYSERREEDVIAAGAAGSPLWVKRKRKAQVGGFPPTFPTNREDDTTTARREWAVLLRQVPTPNIGPSFGDDIHGLVLLGRSLCRRVFFFLLNGFTALSLFNRDGRGRTLAGPVASTALPPAPPRLVKLITPAQLKFVVHVTKRRVHPKIQILCFYPANSLISGTVLWKMQSARSTPRLMWPHH